MELQIGDSRSFLSEGVRAMFLSTLAFSLANVFVKQVSHIPAMEVVFFRCLLGSLFSIYGLRRANASLKGQNHKLLIMRGVFGTTALYFFFVTVQNLPLATAMTIQYLSPILTTVIAIFLLGEKVKAAQWVFYAISFAGVILIKQFDARVSPLFLAMGIVSAFGSGMAYNLVRRLKEKEHPLTVVFHFQFIGMLAGFIFTVFDWKTPVGWDWFYLFLIAVFSQLGQVFLTSALQKEKAASVAIIIYSGLIYGISIGWLFFDEPQTLSSLFGMLLVVGGVVLSIIYANRRQAIEKIESSIG